MKKLIALIFLFLASTLSEGYAQFWVQTHGPGGDNISSIAVNAKGDIFTVSRGLQRSTDGGNSWVRLFESAPLWALRKISVLPNGRLIVAVASDDHHQVSIEGALFVSDDNGLTWKKLTKTVGNLTNTNIQYDINVDTYWVENNGKLFSYQSDIRQYVQSIDNGDTWTPLTLSGVLGQIRSFQSNEGVQFICADYLYRSTDNGASWGKVVNGLENETIREIDVVSGSVLTGFGNHPNISLDNGRTWTSYNSDKPKEVSINKFGRILIVDNYCRVIYSDDSLKSAHSVPGFIQNYYNKVSACCAEPDGSFLISANNSLYRISSSLVVTKLQISNGNTTSIIAHPSGNIAAFNPSAWVTSDQGITWSQTSSAIVAVSAAIDSSKAILYGSNKISRSIDTGKTWTTVSPQLTNGSISGIAVKSNGHIFASTTAEGVFRSTDNGTTWDQLNSGITNQNISSIAVHQNGDVYAGGVNAIYKSVNDGLTWTKLSTNFPTGAMNVSALVVNTQGNIIAGIINAGVYWSTDNGTTWAERAIGFSGRKVNALLSTPSGKVFAASDSGIFFLDAVAGSNWVKYNIGITSKNILSLCRDASGRLYAGTDACGVFRSVGTFNIQSPTHPAFANRDSLVFSWVQVGNAKETTFSGVMTSTGTAPLIITSALIESNGGASQDFVLLDPLQFPITLAPGAEQSFTIRFTPQTVGRITGNLQLITNAPNAETQIPLSAIGLEPADVASDNLLTTVHINIYPNPVINNFQVAFSIEEGSSVSFELTDALGRTVAATTKQPYDAGTHTISFDASNLPNGIYYVTMLDGANTISRKIVK